MANFFRSVLLRLQNKTVTAGTSASSVTKDSGYDGLGTVTINPTPSETKTQAAGTSNIDVTPSSGKLLSKVTVTPTPTEAKSATPSTTAQTITPSSGKHLSSVSISAISTETKSQAAGTSNIDVTPTSGKYLTKVTITPQQHSGSFTPTANLKGASGNANDMGATHSYRYVNTSGMIVPSGTKDNSSSPYTSNGTYTVTGLDSYTGVKLAVNVPSPTITSITPLDSLPISMSANSNYKPTVSSYAITDYTRVDPSQLTAPYQIKDDNMYFIENEWGYIISDYSSISPSNSNPVSLASGSIYKPSTAGYAISSYESKTPSNSSPVSLSNGSIYKMNEAGYAISSYTSATPSNSSPVFLASGSFYKMDKAGYAISSYGGKTPSASGTSFNAGMILMTEAGYAYLTKPSETTLWTNSSPTIGISSGTLLNLSQSMDNFNYLKFYWRYSVTNEGIPCSIMIAVSDMKKCTNDNLDPRVILGGWSGSANYARCIKYNSDTSVYCYNGVKAWGSGSVESNPGWIIPTKITGLKMHAIS